MYFADSVKQGFNPIVLWRRNQRDDTARNKAWKKTEGLYQNRLSAGYQLYIFAVIYFSLLRSEPCSSDFFKTNTCNLFQSSKCSLDI